MSFVFFIPQLITLRSAKGLSQAENKYVKWNSLARISVSDEFSEIDDTFAYKGPDPVEKARVEKIWRLVRAGWGMSSKFEKDVPDTLYIRLDADAGTQIIKGGGYSPEDQEFLKWDVTASGYWLKPQINNVYIIGGGGGRDILTALSFKAKNVNVAELNPDIVDVVDNKFADYAGPIYSRENVNLFKGDARSILSRQDIKYDIIQMSMIDTWASSMAGALVLSEESLYTKEASDLFFKSLSTEGVISISRWYSDKYYPETARVLTTIGEVLKDNGIENPQDHVALIYAKGFTKLSVVTCLVKKTPFTEADLLKIKNLAKKMDFQVFLANSRRCS